MKLGQFMERQTANSKQFHEHLAKLTGGTVQVKDDIAKIVFSELADQLCAVAE